MYIISISNLYIIYICVRDYELLLLGQLVAWPHVMATSRIFQTWMEEIAGARPGPFAHAQRIHPDHPTKLYL